MRLLRYMTASSLERAACCELTRSVRDTSGAQLETHTQGLHRLILADSISPPPFVCALFLRPSSVNKGAESCCWCCCARIMATTSAILLNLSSSSTTSLPPALKDRGASSTLYRADPPSHSAPRSSTPFGWRSRRLSVRHCSLLWPLLSHDSLRRRCISLSLGLSHAVHGPRHRTRPLGLKLHRPWRARRASPAPPLALLPSCAPRSCARTTTISMGSHMRRLAASRRLRRSALASHLRQSPLHSALRCTRA